MIFLWPPYFTPSGDDDDFVSFQPPAEPIEEKIGRILSLLLPFFSGLEEIKQKNYLSPVSHISDTKLLDGPPPFRQLRSGEK